MIASRVQCLQHLWTSGQMHSHEEKTGRTATVRTDKVGNQFFFLFLINLSIEIFKEFIMTFFRKINLGTSR